MTRTGPDYCCRATLLTALILATRFSSVACAGVYEVIATGDAWIQKNAASSNFSTNVNPSTQLRDAAPNIVRIGLYQFTLPKLLAGEIVTGTSFRLVAFDNGSYWNADIGYLHSNPNLSTITWNSAVSAGYITGAPIDGLHHGFGVNATATSDTWTQSPIDDAVASVYVDADASNGLAKYIKNTISTSSTVPITLMLNPSGNNDNLSSALFYGVENGESSEFMPRPRLYITTPGSMFVDVTATAVPGGSLPNGKAAWADYNNDGWTDLNASGTVLRNNKNGTFSHVTSTGGDSIWGDYNNDGFVDMFNYTNGTLWRNSNGNSFSATTALPAMPPVSRGATWGDFNRDGRLDLYVGGYEAGDLSGYYPDAIYTNNGNGTFTKTWTQGLDAQTTPGQPRPARGVTSADWDQDGDLDIYVSNYRLEPNALWQNNGTGSFTDVAAARNALATSPGYFGGHSIGAVWADFNNDGLLDLFAGNFAHAGQPQSRFLKNLGSGAGYSFQDLGTCGVFYQESYASPTVGDIDNDGDLDLFFTTVYPTASGGVPNYPILFRNDGNFQFADVTTSWGLPKTGSIETYQAAFADFDNDGYLDLVTNGKLYRNTGGTNHYLKVHLNGAPLLDATAIGSQVRISLNGQILTRQVEGAVGEGNQNDPSLHFGLGDYTGPLTLDVIWPDGFVETVNVVGVDRTISLFRSLIPGDFDGDGDVDGADFVAWQTNFPKANGATRADGDADGDGDVDGADFVVWQTNFPFAPSAGTGAIPEASSFMMMSIGGLVVTAWCHRALR